MHWILLLVALVLHANANGADVLNYEDARNLKALPAPAVSAIRKNLGSSSYGNCSGFVGKAVDLSGQRKRSDWIAITADGCAWGAATAVMWVLRRQPGGYKIVLTSGGHELSIGTRKRNGLRNIDVISGTVDRYSETHYGFDGSKYVEMGTRVVNLLDPEDCRRNRDVCSQ
jgi:hypothetical protein